MIIRYFVNREVSGYWIFLVLSLNLLSFIPFGNEETYFALAKQFVSPNWISDSFTLTEWPGTRLISQHIIGNLLKYLSFEELAFGGRLSLFFLTSIPLASLFRLMKLELLESLLLVQVYIFFWQSFFAGEWIFKAFEGKTIAYIFIFWSLLLFFRKRSFYAVLMGAVATWFHVLVGGWFMFAALLWRFLENRDIFKTIKEGSLYTVLISPFIIYLGKTILVDSRSVIEGVNIDWVYVYFRNPHHTAPFGSLDCFLKNFALGIVLSIGAFIFFIKKRKELQGLTASLNRLNLIIFSILFCFLLVGIWDTDGSILKFYTFRLSGLSLFLTLLEFLVIFKDYFKRVNWKKFGALLLISLCLLGLFRNLYGIVEGVKRGRTMEHLASRSSEISKAGDVFMFLNGDAVDFIRRSGRERFVVWKFDPGGGEKIYQWYIRVLEKRRVEKNPGYLKELKSRYRIDYLISDKSLLQDFLEEKWVGEKYWIYGVK